MQFELIINWIFLFYMNIYKVNIILFIMFRKASVDKPLSIQAKIFQTNERSKVCGVIGHLLPAVCVRCRAYSVPRNSRHHLLTPRNCATLITYHNNLSDSLVKFYNLANGQEHYNSNNCPWLWPIKWWRLATLNISWLWIMWVCFIERLTTLTTI